MVHDLLVVLATEEDGESTIPVIVACTAKLLKDTETFIRSVTVRAYVTGVYVFQGKLALSCRSCSAQHCHFDDTRLRQLMLTGGTNQSDVTHTRALKAQTLTDLVSEYAKRAGSY